MATPGGGRQLVRREVPRNVIDQPPSTVPMGYEQQVASQGRLNTVGFQQTRSRCGRPAHPTGNQHGHQENGNTASDHIIPFTAP